ncbi:uncharacterized protein LOC116001325 [Ipomoea triloba]|uniref:uncharacterized protein LOC116001325 n=1 Tax=Ipomoea triloba TaxID=35885 RepID=UPI00125D4BE9|nr:uncharacterized protein LOC116001325 [Ipomoea triloba]
MVYSSGLSGGIALLWKIRNSVNLVSYSIDVRVALANAKEWRLTGYYRHPERHNGEASWNLIRSLSNNSDLPWLMLGDLTKNSEKRGLRQQPNALIDGFNSALNDSGFHDIGMHGYQFTWSRGRGTPGWVEEREEKQRHFTYSFRFKNVWLEEEECQNIVLNGADLPSRIDLCAQILSHWGGSYDNKFQKIKEDYRRRLDYLKPKQDQASMDEYCTIERVSHIVKFGRNLLETEIKTTLVVSSGWQYKIFPPVCFGEEKEKPHYSVSNCVSACQFPQGLGKANIVLLPKKQTLETVAELRPIALCNTIYKVIAKLLANRMKGMLRGLIAFVPNRLITDNKLIAAEAGHFLRRKVGGVQGLAGLKLDMAKAYDRMEWDYVRFMLTKFSFADEWVNLIMLCLSALIRDAEMKGTIHGCQIARGAPAVTHLISNTPTETRAMISNCIAVPIAADFGKYLGLPSVIGRNKTEVFKYIDQKIRQRVGSWQKKLLSCARKETLIKSVAQSLPTYSMSVYLLPDSLCDTLQKVMNKYFWESGGGNSRGVHWLSWDRLAFPKGQGGLGFKS